MDEAGTTPTFTTWESYFYPETLDPATRVGTLVNTFDERDPDVLEVLEYGHTADRQSEIELRQVEIPKTYDADHIRAIHRHVFGDVYPWAGEYRTVGLQKGLSRFAGTRDIPRHLDDAARIIRETPWPELDRNGFAAKAAEVFAYVNQAHPFREGNGRASKIFMEQVADLSNFRLDYDPQVSGISKEVWNQRSMLSGPDLGQYEPEPSPLVEVFRNLAQPAPNGPAASLPEEQ